MVEDGVGAVPFTCRESRRSATPCIGVGFEGANEELGELLCSGSFVLRSLERRTTRCTLEESTRQISF
jgi:hypothetical protein